MIIKIKTFEDGRKSYATGIVNNSINDQSPVKEEEVIVDDEMGWKFLNNPLAYELSVMNGKGIIAAK